MSLFVYDKQHTATERVDWTRKLARLINLLQTTVVVNDDKIKQWSVAVKRLYVKTYEVKDFAWNNCTNFEKILIEATDLMVVYVMLI